MVNIIRVRRKGIEWIILDQEGRGRMDNIRYRRKGIGWIILDQGGKG